MTACVKPVQLCAPLRSDVRRPDACTASTATSICVRLGAEIQAVTEKHCRRQDRPRGVSQIATGDIRCGAVNRLNNPGCFAPSDADPSKPIEPGSMEASSLRMSPNMFSVSTTSKLRGFWIRRIAAVSTSM